MAKYNTPQDFWASVNIGQENECWEWLGYCQSYGKVHYQHKLWLAHRLAHFLTYGCILTKQQCVCHMCDNPKCCNPKHFFIGSQADNRADCVIKQRQAKGETNSQTKLSADNVIRLRNMFAEGVSKHALSREFGINRKTVTDIVRRNIWKHV